MKNKPCRCDFCGEIILDVDIGFEDYYAYHRGCTLDAEAGYICFDCLQANRKKSYVKKRKD
jgi:hypothetical protein